MRGERIAPTTKSRDPFRQPVDCVTVGRQRLRTLVAGVMTTGQTLHERPGLLHRKPEVDQRADLLDLAQGHRRVVPITVGQPGGHREPGRLAVPQRPGPKGRLALAAVKEFGGTPLR